MKLKFRYVFFILLSRSFISADSVRAVDSDTETVSSFISADRVRAVDSDTETVIHNALVDVLSLELGVRYPNVPWRSTHRRRFAGLTDERKACLLNTCDAEKCEAVLSHFQFQALTQCSMREFKNLLRFPLDVIERFMFSMPDNLERYCRFLHLNDDELNVLLGFPSSRILKFTCNPEQFSSILKIGLNYFRPLNDDQFNNVFRLFSEDIEEFKRFTPEHIPVLLETENLEKTDTILYSFRTNSQASQMLEPQTIMRFLHLPLEAVKKLMLNFDPQRDGSFVHLNDDEFTTLRGFSDGRIIQFAWDSELFLLLLDVGLQHFQPLHDDQLNNVKIFWRDDIKELKRFAPEHIPVLLETENFEKTKNILHYLRRDYQASQVVETKPIMRLLHLPLEAVEMLMYSTNPQLPGPFLQLNDDEFNEFKKFSTGRMKRLINNSKILPDILKFGLEQVRNLPDYEFNTLVNRTLDQVGQLR